VQELNDVSEDKSAGLLKSDDLCASIKCGVGEQCVINDNEATCQCFEVCEVPADERQKVCSSANQTFDSDCHFLKQKCLCARKDVKCANARIVEDKLDYYGACKCNIFFSHQKSKLLIYLK
jgi:hypothetical protein